MATVLSPYDPAEDDGPVVEEGMTDDELASLLESFATQAVGEEWGEIAEQQERAIDYYYHRMPDLPAQEGSSGVVSDTVQVTIDDAMAEVLKPFVSSDEYAQFEPVSAEDEQQAEQATAYVNYVLTSDNPGFIIFHDWFKDALLTKVGVVKVWWKDTVEVKAHEVDAEQLLEARQHPSYAGEEPISEGAWRAMIAEPDGRAIIDNIPPEEFKISPFARSIEEAPYTAHAPRNTTRSDLIEMGYDRETVDALPTWQGSGGEEGRRDARYRDERYGGTNIGSGTPHQSQEVLAFREEYLRVDFDGDGIAELRKIHRVGDVILLNEEVADHPFALLCPKPMPHKVYGVSLADDVLELQKVDTVLTRQTLDNLYKSNNPRPVIGEAAERTDGTTLDSLGDTAPGAAIYVRIPDALTFEAVPFTADKSFQMLQYTSQKRAERTGFQPLGNGLDRDALNKSRAMTATQASQQEDKQNARAEMIARIFAETGVKRLMKLILATLVRHQPKARMIRLRNEWVEMDPRGWNPDMDLKLSVGMGTGNKAEQIAEASSVLEVVERVAGSPYAQLVTPENAYNALVKFLRAAGCKNIDNYATKPDPNAPPPEKPDPEMMKVQAEMQMQQAKLQGEQQLAAAKAEAQRQEAAMQQELARARAAAELQLARDKAGAEMQLAREKAQFEAEMAQQQMQQELELEERRMQMQERQADHKASLDEKAALSKNRPGGDLDK